MNRISFQSGSKMGFNIGAVAQDMFFKAQEVGNYFKLSGYCKNNHRILDKKL